MQSVITIAHVESVEDLESSFCVMQELRPHLQDRVAYVAQVRQQAAQGYRLLAAWSDGDIVGLAGYRLTHNLLYSSFVYVDDLVVAARLQRAGVGALLLKAVRQRALDLHCTHLILDTGLHMALAQRFYFRQGLLARGMHFVEALTKNDVAQNTQGK